MAKQYINKNVGGGYDGWRLVPISDDTILECRRETFEDNLSILNRIKEKMPDQIQESDLTDDQEKKGITGYTEGERLAMFNMMAQHTHYKVESRVDEAIDAGIIGKDKIKPV